MKCAPRSDIGKAVKKCVYCKRNFKIHPNQKETRVVKRLLK
ncbi:hypothetical protein ACFL1B_04805 [Nanoarchaeota archaeon]